MRPPGLAIDSTKIALVFGDSAASKRLRLLDVGPHDVPAEGLEGVVELVDRAAVELARGNELVARPHQRVEGDELGGMAGRHGKGGRAAFERGDLGFENRLGGVHDAGVDVAEGPQREQVGRVLDVLEDVGRRLVDRRGARAGRRVGLRAGVDRERVEAVGPFGHVRSPLESPCRCFRFLPEARGRDNRLIVQPSGHGPNAAIRAV
jgi:hypothetical protein